MKKINAKYALKVVIKFVIEKKNNVDEQLVAEHLAEKLEITYIQAKNAYQHMFNAGYVIRTFDPTSKVMLASITKKACDWVRKTNAEREREEEGDQYDNIVESPVGTVGFRDGIE